MVESAATWQRVKFGEVVRLNKETCKDPTSAGIERVIGLEHIEPGDLCVRAWGDVADGTTFTNRVRPGQVLFGKRRAYQRKVAVASFEAICSGDIYVFESADPSKLLPELLPFICQTDSFFEHAVGTSAGSLSPRTNWPSLAEYEFALPPIELQSACSRLLNATEALIATLQAAATSARDARVSLSRDLFGRAIGFRDRLGTWIDESSYGPRFGAELYSTDGPVAQLRTTDIDSDGNIHYETIPRVALDPGDMATHLLRDGDLVISRSGTCGLTAVFHATEIPTVAAAFLVRLRTCEALDPRYLHEWFCSPMGRSVTASLARGGVQKNISASELLNEQFQLPSPQLQEQVVEAIARAREAESAIARRLASARELRAAALRDALRG